jgi:hypothetical protein
LIGVLKQAVSKRGGIDNNVRHPTETEKKKLKICGATRPGPLMVKTEKHE